MAASIAGSYYFSRTFTPRRRGSAARAARSRPARTWPSRRYAIRFHFTARESDEESTTCVVAIGEPARLFTADRPRSSVASSAYVKRCNFASGSSRTTRYGEPRRASACDRRSWECRRTCKTRRWRDNPQQHAQAPWLDEVERLCGSGGLQKKWQGGRHADRLHPPPPSASRRKKSTRQPPVARSWRRTYSEPPRTRTRK